MRPVTATVTSVSPTAMVRLDQYHGAALAVQAVVTAGTFQIQHSFDDPNDTVNPVPVASMAWDQSLIPATVMGNASTTFVIHTAPIWAMVTLTSGAGPIRVTFVQYEAHRTMIQPTAPGGQFMAPFHQMDQPYEPRSNP
jgi:hypothetical protein